MFSQDSNSCYFISNSSDVATWDEAIDKCKQKAKPYNGALLALNSQDEVVSHQLLKGWCESDVDFEEL